MRVAIFGSDGQLGRDVCASFGGHDVVEIPHARADVTDDEAVHRAVDAAAPEVIVNCAAMTDVDGCESETIPAFQINAIGARNIARASSVVGARLIHISTDYVFDGAIERPYVETDPPNPLNVYGMSKLAGEIFVRNECRASYVLRTSGLYGTHECRGKGTNFVETMLRLAKQRTALRVVDDERLTPTYTMDLAEQILAVAESPLEPGIYHATNAGGCSWYEFAAEIFRIEEAGVDLQKTTAAEWGSITRRPANSVLENRALAKAGIDTFPDWRDALSRYLEERLDDED